MTGEIIIDAKRKRSWPKDLKRQIVAESYADGVSVCEVARRYDLEPSQLFHWRKQFREDAGAVDQACLADPAEFFPIEVASGVATEGVASGADDMDRPIASSRAEIAFPNGRRLFVPPTLDRILLNALIAAVAAV